MNEINRPDSTSNVPWPAGDSKVQEPDTSMLPDSEKAPAAAVGLLKNAAQGAHHTIDRLADSATPAVRRLGESVAAAGETLHAKTEQLRETRDEWVEGARSTVRVGRQMALPSGWLSANIGYGRTEAGNEGPVASIYWLEQFPRGSVIASLDRRIVTNSNDLDTTSTTMRLELSHDVTSLAQIALRTDYVMWEVDGGEDIDRGTLRLSWDRQISEEWGISTGIEHRYRREEYETGAANSSGVFLTLARVVEFAR